MDALLPIGVPAGDCGSAPWCWACCWPWPTTAPAHLTRVHEALTAFPEPDRVRLSVTAASKTARRLLT